MYRETSGSCGRGLGNGFLSSASQADQSAHLMLLLSVRLFYMSSLCLSIVNRASNRLLLTSQIRFLFRDFNCFFCPNPAFSFVSPAVHNITISSNSKTQHPPAARWLSPFLLSAETDFCTHPSTPDAPTDRHRVRD